MTSKFMIIKAEGFPKKPKGNHRLKYVIIKRKTLFLEIVVMRLYNAKNLYIIKT